MCRACAKRWVRADTSCCLARLCWSVSVYFWGLPLLHMLPFQTPTFDPADPEMLQRVYSGKRVTGLILGLTVFIVDGERWIVISYPCPEPWKPFLAYPLPMAYGEDHVRAAGLFEQAWRLERLKLWEADPSSAPKPLESTPQISPARGRDPGRGKRRIPPTRNQQQDAVPSPLPGLESWISPRR